MDSSLRLVLEPLLVGIGLFTVGVVLFFFGCYLLAKKMDGFGIAWLLPAGLIWPMLSILVGGTLLFFGGGLLWQALGVAAILSGVAMGSHIGWLTYTVRKLKNSSGKQAGFI